MSITDRIDAITLIPDEYRATVLPAPKSVKIELTGRCNLACSFCALRTRTKQPKGDMDFALFERVTREMRDAGVQEIGMFYLGESTMAPEKLVSGIDWCKNELNFPYVFLTTNGTRCFPELVDKMMSAGLDSLKFSVNAYNAHQFFELMGVSAKLWRNALTNIALAREVRDLRGYKCKIYASSIQYDGEQLGKMQGLLDEKVLPFVDQHYWLPLYAQMTSVTSARAKELGFSPNAGNQGRVGALREPLPCWSAFMGGHLRADGVLTACCFDPDGRFAMGDLKKISFMKAWNSQSFQDLRAAHLRKSVTGTICEGCIAYAA